MDKYATKAYSLIHNVSEELNLGDITKVDETKLPEFDLMTWGFPCTDISIAGKQEGFVDKDGNKTRSGLYYEGLRILQEKKPKYSIIENVKNLTGKKFKKQFEQILNDLENEGYNNYWQVLNAKDYGIPQNRERVFIVSIRKDIDDGKFEFPKGFNNGIRLKDLLEEKVEEKYYISQDKVDKLLEKLKYKQYSNAIRSGGRGSLDRHSCDLVAVNNNLKQIGYINDTNSQGHRVYDPNYISTTMVGNAGGLGGKTGLYLFNDYRIRRLTPLECLRLMGFDDHDYYILKENGISDTQIYKMAGNSIVVNVLEHIFIKLIK